MILAGGTGGHVFPGLAVAEVLRERGVPVVWMGSAHGPENRWVPGSGLPLERLSVSGLRGKGVGGWLAAPWRLARAVFQAERILRRRAPRAVLSMGGFAAGPGGLAAWRRRVPLLVHEQNSLPGLTNRVLARFAARVMTGFPRVMPNAEVTGNPVRRALAHLASPGARFSRREGPARLLVLGGSQGARRMNELVPAALARIPAGRRPLVRHQCGERHLEATRRTYDAAGVEAEVEAFIEDMADAYCWADLAVARAGALTLAELAAVGLGSLLVPFPFAVDDHQSVNARHFVSAGAAEMHQERDLDETRLAERLDLLLSDRHHLRVMAGAARGLAIPDAAERVADACLEV